MSGKQEIGISEMSEFFGITPEAIRKYEGKGIVQVRRDESNKYRKYTMWEVMAMLQARRFSQIGFTLGQASELLKTSDGESYIHSLDELQRKLAEEVAWKRKLIILLDQKKKQRCSIESQGDQIQIEYLDDILLFEIGKNLSLNEKDSAQIRNEWIEALPFISECIVCDRWDGSHWTIYFAVNKKDVKLYELDHLKISRTLPAGFYATCILKGDYDELITEKKISETASRIESMGHRIVGEVFSEIFDYAKVDGKYEALHKCCFPVEI